MLIRLRATAPENAFTLRGIGGCQTLPTGKREAGTFEGYKERNIDLEEKNPKELSTQIFWFGKDGEIKNPLRAT